MRQGLPAHPSSVGRARRLVRQHLQGTALEPLADTAELVVSEVVTNAIVHTGDGIEVATSLDDTGLRVEVADSSTHLPVVASYDAMASTGWGLHLVAELTDQWGVETRPDGKVFWFHIGLTVRESGRLSPDMVMSTTGSDRGPSDPGNDVTVELLNMPAAIHAAWQQHAKSLLRDLLLLGIDVEASQEIEAHAAAMDALAILEEQVGRPEDGEQGSGRDFDEDSADSASAARAPRLKVHVVVPQDSVPHFETLDQQLDTAMSYATAGRLLTAPTQPEFDAFRRWMCEQVRVQAEGRPARPWSTPPIAADASTNPTPYRDLSAVNESSRALVGADRTGMIVAASPAAVDLLKHDSQDDLIGTRLVDLVPARQDRAHLAGFTVHQITGQSPMLGLDIAVTARCGDGSEVDVQLTVSAALGSDGASYFLADLQTDHR